MSKKTILKSAAVLAIITAVSIAILVVVNSFWSVSEDEKFARSVASIMKADSFTTVYNFDDPTDQHKQSEEYKKIADFNKQYGATDKVINKVHQAVGGDYSGCYLIQSTGRGYNQHYVKMLTGYDKNGAILGVMDLDISSGNNLKGYINWDKVNQKLKGKSGNVGSGGDIVAGTGATRTLDGAAEAVNLATEFYQKVIKGEKETAKMVTDATQIVRLNRLFDIPDSAYSGTAVTEFMQYPIKTAEASIMGGKANIQNVYMGDGKYLVLEAKGSYGSYGGWTLLVLINNEDGTIAAVNPIASNYDVYEDYDASVLNSAAVLTKLFKGKTKADIEGMEDKYLQGTTGATQTSAGAKLTAAYAQSVQTEIRQMLADFVANAAAEG